RFLHYVLDHTIWYDEAVLLANILGKDYVRLLGPLDNEVAAPPLFLWLLRTIAVVVGDQSYAWRIPFFLASSAMLLVMAALARRILQPVPAALVIGLVAFSDAFVWLGCNVKPYIFDALIASAVLYAYVRTEDWPLSKRLHLFAAAAPL